jgi:hypothetical protein
MTLKSNAELEPGDIIRVSKQAEVSFTDGNRIYTLDGGCYSNISTSGKSKDWEVELIVRPKKKPEHWPPQFGDVWLGTDNREYVVLASRATSGTKPFIRTAEDKYGGVDDFTTYEAFMPRASKLLHRVGNRP